MFSGRVPAVLEPNRLTLALAHRRQDGRPTLDLTRSNPTRAGLDYPADLLMPLGHRCGLDYAPAPLGLEDARRAVADDCARRSRPVAPENVVLTASTSEAYSLAFKILCNPGDEVLIPRPSYPLFEHLTRLDAVAAVPYALEYHGRWSLDLADVERALTPRARALLVVNPNNPTGNFVGAGDMRRLAELCEARDVAIIADEVFADYELSPGAAARAGRLSEQAGVLGITLGGLSKSIGLPQVKLAWMILSGPPPLVDAARARLELAADTYLSVATPVQAAAGALLASGAAVRQQIQRRVACNHRRLREQTATAPSCGVLDSEGGWYAVLQVPSIVSEEELTLALLNEDDVLVHPGYFFDFASESFLVVSLLTPESEFDEGLARILRRFEDGRP